MLCECTALPPAPTSKAEGLVHMHVHVHRHTHAQTHTRAHTHARTHVRTRTRARLPPCAWPRRIMRAIMGKLPQSRINDSDGSLAAVLYMLFRLAPDNFVVRRRGRVCSCHGDHAPLSVRRVTLVRLLCQTWFAHAMRTVIPESVISAPSQATFLAELIKSPDGDKFAALLLDLSDNGYQMRT